MSRNIVIILMALLVSAPSLAKVPAPQIGPVKQRIRNFRGKLAVKIMAARIKRAHLAPPIERLLLHNLAKVKRNGERHGTFSLSSMKKYNRVEAVGHYKRRFVSRDWGYFKRFNLELSPVGEKTKHSARYIALTKNVTVAQVGENKYIAIEHKDGKVTQRRRLKMGKYNYDRMNLYTAQRLLEQGGLTLEQALKEAKLVP